MVNTTSCNLYDAEGVVEGILLGAVTWMRKEKTYGKCFKRTLQYKMLTRLPLILEIIIYSKRCLQIRGYKFILQSYHHVTYTMEQ